MTDSPLVQDFATDWDHSDPQWVADPYPIWDDLRQRCPVAHTERYGGGWFPVTHAGVSEIAKDTDNFTSRNVVIGNGRPTELDLPAPIGVAPPITSDQRRRALGDRAWRGDRCRGGPRARQGFRLLDELVGEGVVNAGTKYAQYIPPGVIRGMLGFPEEDIEHFLEMVHIIMEGIDHAEEERIVAFEPVEAYFAAQMEDHVDNPRDDLTSYLLNVELDGQNLAMEHVFGTMVLILVAGIDTTWSAIGSAIWHLAQNPEDLARLVNEPDLMPVAIEEFLRFYAPVTMARLVKHDMEYQGCPMKEDDWILLGFPAANRDPVAFKDADQFIIDRAENRHVAFGLGIHRCAGSNLARLEMRVALEEFIKRYPRFDLAEPEAVTWAPGQIRGPRNLPIRILP